MGHACELFPHSKCPLQAIHIYRLLFCKNCWEGTKGIKCSLHQCLSATNTYYISRPPRKLLFISIPRGKVHHSMFPKLLGANVPQSESHPETLSNIIFIKNVLICTADHGQAAGLCPALPETGRIYAPALLSCSVHPCSLGLQLELTLW